VNTVFLPAGVNSISISKTAKKWVRGDRDGAFYGVFSLDFASRSIVGVVVALHSGLLIKLSGANPCPPPGVYIH